MTCTIFTSLMCNSKCNILFNFINLTQVHNFTVSAQDIFTFRRLSVFTVSFTGDWKTKIGLFCLVPSSKTNKLDSDPCSVKMIKSAGVFSILYSRLQKAFVFIDCCAYNFDSGLCSSLVF